MTAHRKPGDPLRVVHVITTLDVGGAEMMLVRLLERMRLDRYRTTVVSLTSRGPLAARIEALGVEVIPLGLRPGLGALRGVMGLARILRRERPDVVQTWLYHADLVGLLAARFGGRPPVAWNIRCAELDPRDHPASLRWVLATLARVSPSATAVVVNSHAGRVASEALGYRPRRWVSLPNGFDVVQFAPRPDARTRLRKELGVDARTPLVGLVARFHPMKDHQTFLRAAAFLHRERPDVHFVLAGRRVDAANAALNSSIQALGLHSVVHLMGESDDVPTLTAALDVATSSSYSEGFPNTIGEAMASGVPTVATDVGESRQLIADTGIVVPPRDAEALADGWRRMLALSEEARQALGAAARARIERHFEIGTIARQYEAFYDELADGPASM